MNRHKNGTDWNKITIIALIVIISVAGLVVIDSFADLRQGNEYLTEGNNLRAQGKNNDAIKKYKNAINEFKRVLGNKRAKNRAKNKAKNKANAGIKKAKNGIKKAKISYLKDAGESLKNAYKLKAQGKNDKAIDKFGEAIDKFNKVLEIDSNNQDAKEGIKRAFEGMKGDYIPERPTTFTVEIVGLSDWVTIIVVVVLLLLVIIIVILKDIKDIKKSLGEIKEKRVEQRGSGGKNGDDEKNIKAIQETINRLEQKIGKIADKIIAELKGIADTMKNKKKQGEALCVDGGNDTSLDNQPLKGLIRQYNEIAKTKITSEKINEFIKDWRCKYVGPPTSHQEGNLQFKEAKAQGDFLLVKIDNSAYVLPVFFSSLNNDKEPMLKKCYETENLEAIKEGNYHITKPAIVDDGLRLVDDGKGIIKGGKEEQKSPPSP